MNKCIKDFERLSSISGIVFTVLMFIAVFSLVYLHAVKKQSEVLAYEVVSFSYLLAEEPIPAGDMYEYSDTAEDDTYEEPVEDAELILEAEEPEPEQEEKPETKPKENKNEVDEPEQEKSDELKSLFAEDAESGGKEVPDSDDYIYDYESRTAADESFISEFMARIKAALYYPPNARKAGITGEVKVRIIFDAYGSIEDVSLVDENAHRVLSSAALKTVDKVREGWVSTHYTGKKQALIIPIRFDLK